MRRPAIMALLALALGVSACAYYDDYGSGYAYGPPGGSLYGDYTYAGAAYDRGGWDEESMRLGGPGAHILDPWLALTSEGRDILALGFNAGANGAISREMADRANVWFRRYADSDRDMRLTDEEIRIALAHASKEGARSGY
jgi:hypothetical protein